MILTKELAVSHHKSMWLYLANLIRQNGEVINIEIEKDIYMEENGFDCMFSCFLCEYAYINNNRLLSNRCEKCPMQKFPFNDACLNGLYSHAITEKNYVWQAYLCELIANLAVVN